MDTVVFTVTAYKDGSYDITTKHRKYSQFKRLNVSADTLGYQMKSLAIQINNQPDAFGVLFEMD